jgi:hypothetical protein
MNIRCSECRKDMMDPIKPRWQAWTRLANYLQIANLQGEITDDLYEQLVEDLDWFKPEGEDDEQDDG